MSTAVIIAPARPATEREGARPSSSRDTATAGTGLPARERETATLAIRHNVLRDALARTMGTPPDGAEAMGARVKALLGLGLRRDGGPAPGRGRGHRNGLPDALDVALALTLQRAFVPPAAAAAFLVANRDAVDGLWAAAARGERAAITVAIDALSHAGRTGRRTGRLSEDPVGTLSVAETRGARATPHSVRPPEVTIDLRALYDVTTDNLRRAGVPRADLRRAENALAAGARG